MYKFSRGDRLYITGDPSRAICAAPWAESAIVDGPADALERIIDAFTASLRSLRICSKAYFHVRAPNLEYIYAAGYVTLEPSDPKVCALMPHLCCDRRQGRDTHGVCTTVASRLPLLRLARGVLLDGLAPNMHDAYMIMNDTNIYIRHANRDLCKLAVINRVGDVMGGLVPTDQVYRISRKAKSMHIDDAVTLFSHLTIWRSMTQLSAPLLPLSTRYITCGTCKQHLPALRRAEVRHLPAGWEQLWPQVKYLDTRGIVCLASAPETLRVVYCGGVVGNIPKWIRKVVIRGTHSIPSNTHRMECDGVCVVLRAGYQKIYMHSTHSTRSTQHNSSPCDSHRRVDLQDMNNSTVRCPCGERSTKTTIDTKRGKTIYRRRCAKCV